MSPYLLTTLTSSHPHLSLPVSANLNYTSISSHFLCHFFPTSWKPISVCLYWWSLAMFCVPWPLINWFLDFFVSLAFFFFISFKSILNDRSWLQHKPISTTSLPFQSLPLFPSTKVWKFIQPNATTLTFWLSKNSFFIWSVIDLQC